MALQRAIPGRVRARPCTWQAGDGDFPIVLILTYRNSLRSLKASLLPVAKHIGEIVHLARLRISQLRQALPFAQPPMLSVTSLGRRALY